MELDECDIALKYFHKELDLWNQFGIIEYERIAIAYKNIGDVHLWKDENDLALEYEFKALGMLANDHHERANVYETIANAYRDKRQFEEATDYFQKALEIQKCLLPEHHPSIGKTYNDIGYAYENMRNYPKAIEYYSNSIENDRKSLPPNHADLLQTYCNLDRALAISRFNY